jgi:hypothetical protein
MSLIFQVFADKNSILPHLRGTNRRGNVKITFLALFAFLEDDPGKGAGV